MTIFYFYYIFPNKSKHIKGGFTIYYQLLHRKKELEIHIQNIKNILPQLPQGKLICTHSNKSYKWYISDSHTHTYLPKSMRHIAEQLAYKRYLTMRLAELEKELRITQKYIDICSKPSAADNFLINSPEFQKLIAPYYTPLSNDLSNWMNRPYDKNPLYINNLIHKSISGNNLRSKSEAIIDMLLYQEKIPYRYECQLVLGDKIIYPDFTIRHPITGKFYYWEHFGQMDNPEYFPKACSKMQLYISHGIIPSINLITTYETSEFPLASEDVLKIIKHYFN